MLSSFLAAAFALNSPEYALQEKIRENVYQRVVPCTTRLPRADEVDGVHYRFMSVPQFLALERNGQLLESGMYKGNHYGTPRPEPNATALESLVLNRLSLSTSSSVHQTGDDLCAIPPPLPPLASLTNTISVQSGTKLASVFPQQPLVGQHPAPPRPPLRQSSINNHPGCNPTEAVPPWEQHGSASQPPPPPPPPPPHPQPWQGGNGVDGMRNKSYCLDCDLTTEHHISDPANGIGPEVSKANESVGLESPPAVVQDKALPYGWEVIRDPDYGTFYIDHIRERTQYEPPTSEDYAMAASLQAQLLANSSNGVTTPRTPDLPVKTLSTSPIAQRITPTLFSEDRSKLFGPILTTTLQKGSKGFGFTIVGGSDCDRSAFLQIKHIVPGGPAAINNCLAVGDVLVAVNATSVLGFTHAQLVDLFQSIPVGSCVQLTVSQGYRLLTERPESGISDTSVTPPHTDHSDVKPAAETDMARMYSPTFDPTHTRDSSVLSNSPQASNTASPQSSLSGPVPHSGLKYLLNSAPSDEKKPTKVRMSQRPEFLKVSIVKQPSGFGFTLADHPQGQHVKAILDPGRCGHLQVGDVLVEINDQRVKEMPHAEVVQLLKQCPVDHEARLLVQRGGLYTAPWSFGALNSERPGRADNPSPGSFEDKITPVSGTQFATSTSDSVNVSMTPADGVNSNGVRAHNRFPSGGLVNLMMSRSPGVTTRNPHRPADADPFGELASRQKSNTAAALALRSPKPTKHSIVSADRRRRAQPMDDSVLDYVRSTALPDALDHSTQYGSLLRTGRTRPTQHGDSAGQAGARTSFLMLPGEFLVHLQRQSTGFGFNVVGGAEENSQVVIGSLVSGGAAQLSGVVRSGDRLVSINGVRVVGAKHSDVVRLLEQAAHTVGQVTLGLQRPPDFKRRLPFLSTRDTVEVVVPRSPRGDGFGFFISNTHPNTLGNGPSNGSLLHSKPEGEYIAQLVPGSKAEQLGLLSVGDRIVAVNKVPIGGLHHDQVVRLIRESGNHIVLDILPSAASAWAVRPAQSQQQQQQRQQPGAVPIEFPVTLFRGSRGFGFSIRGGHEFDRMPLLVLRIVDGGAAQMDGRLKIGDELVEINGHSTMGMSHGRAIEIIQAGGNTMHLTVRRHTSAGDIDRMTNYPNANHTVGLRNNTSPRKNPTRSNVPKSQASCVVSMARSHPFRSTEPGNSVGVSHPNRSLAMKMRTSTRTCN